MTGQASRQRLKRGELKIIRGDLILVARFKPEQFDGAPSVTFQEMDGGTVMVAVPPEQIATMATAAMQLAQVAKEPRSNQPAGPLPMERSTAIPADQLSVLDPTKVGAPAGHAVLRIHVGDVPFDFSAPVEVWRQMLAGLTDAGGRGTIQ